MPILGKRISSTSSEEECAPRWVAIFLFKTYLFATVWFSVMKWSSVFFFSIAKKCKRFLRASERQQYVANPVLKVQSFNFFTCLLITLQLQVIYVFYIQVFGYVEYTLETQIRMKSVLVTKIHKHFSYLHSWIRADKILDNNLLHVVMLSSFKEIVLNESWC